MNRIRAGFSAMIVLAVCACTQKPAPVVRYTQLEGAGSTGIHTILPGDTVGSIANRYKIDIRDILVVNALQAPYKLKPGERLKLPAPRSYKTRDGDTLYEVAHMFSASPSQLVRLNNLHAPYALRGGQILKLPVLEDAAPVPTAMASLAPSPGLIPSVSLTTPSSAIERETLAAPPANPSGAHPQQIATAQLSAPPIAAPPPQMAQPVLAAKVPDETPPRSGNGKFMLPVDGKILSSYGPKPDGLHNDGVNIKAAFGTPVHAAENGVVVYSAGDLKGYGNMVLIRHADRWMTAYAHLATSSVKKGQVVKRGQTIGTVGSSGNVDQPQLHFEIRRGTDALNPEKFI